MRYIYLHLYAYGWVIVLVAWLRREFEIFIFSHINLYSRGTTINWNRISRDQSFKMWFFVVVGLCCHHRHRCFDHNIFFFSVSYIETGMMCNVHVIVVLLLLVVLPFGIVDIITVCRFRINKHLQWSSSNEIKIFNENCQNFNHLFSFYTIDSTINGIHVGDCILWMCACMFVRCQIVHLHKQ